MSMAAAQVQRLAYSINEVAEMLHVNHSTVRREIAAGEIKAKRVRNQWRIPVEEFDAYWERISQ